MRTLVQISFVVWTLGMVYLLFSPGSEIPHWELFSGQDKVAHAGLFGGWCFLLLLMLPPGGPSFWRVFFIGVIVALLSEFIQGFIPYRTGDVNDFVADILGVISGSALAFFVKKELIINEKKFD